MMLHNLANGHSPQRPDEIGIHLNILFASVLDLSSHVTHACLCMHPGQRKEYISLLNQVLEETKNSTEEIAHVIRNSGRILHGTAREVFQRSALPDYPSVFQECESHWKALQVSILSLQKQIRKTINEVEGVENYEISDLLSLLDRHCENMLDLMVKDQERVH